MGDKINWIKKHRIEIIFIFVFGVIVLLSSGENHEFWRELSGILIVVLIFTISSLWAVRTSAFYSYAQERSNFYHYMVDHKENYKWYKDKEKIIEDPASQYLTSSRSFRNQAIIYNMMLFYLFICLVFLFIQFLFNLKTFSFIERLLFLDVTLLLFSFMIIVAIYKKLPDEIFLIITLLPFLCPILIFLLVLITGRTYPYLNILLFSIASYLAYLSLRIFQSTLSSYDPYNEFVIWTYDNMDIIPSLQAKKGAGINPDAKKENEMVNFWKWSLVLNLKEILIHIKYDGNLRGTWRHNEEYVENLIATLTASEWEDPSIIYLFAIVRRLLSFLKIDNRPKSNESVEKPRYEHAEEAADKRWKQLEKKLSYMEDEIECLRKLYDEVDKIIDNFKSKKDEIKDICDALIEIYKNRTKN